MTDSPSRFSQLGTRVATAVVFVIIMFGGIFFHPYSLFALFGLVTVLGAWEYQTLVQQHPQNANARPLPDRWLLALVSVATYVLISGVALGWWSAARLVLLLPLVFLLFAKELFDADSTQPILRLSLHIAGVVYIALPLGLVNWIVNVEGDFRPIRLVGILLLIWANDSIAYLTGSRLGRTKFFERISPKKTWEGTIGGVVATLLLAYILSTLFDAFGRGQWLTIGLLVAIFATTGDLIESMFKRNVGVKDSGTLLPGHGGILDRFDALFYALPFIYTYLALK